MRQRSQPETRPTRPESADCPGEDVLQSLAAGIAGPGLMDKHGMHIAGCGPCALILKTYVHEFSDDLTAEEEAILTELESSTPEGQKKLIQKLLRQMGERRGNSSG